MSRLSLIRTAGICARAVALLVPLLPATLRAEESLTQNDFAIDLVEGPVLGAGRIVGLGGAYTAAAEGIDGASWTPAAYAARSPWELDWFEWQIDVGALFPGSFAQNDFFNSGASDGFRFREFVFFTLGFRLQFGDLGIGSLGRTEYFRIRAPTGETVTAGFASGNSGIARQFFGGQLVLGVAGRSADFALTFPNSAAELVSFTGTGLEVGLLLRPEGRRWRFGISTRRPVHSRRVRGADAATGEDGVLRARGMVLPRDIAMPWEVAVGVAWQLGDRPFNRAWRDPVEEEVPILDEVTLARSEHERAQVSDELRAQGVDVQAAESDPYRWLPRRAASAEFLARRAVEVETENQQIEDRIEAAEERRQREVRALSRHDFVVTADVIVTGPTADGVGIEGFLAQERVRAGEHITYALRVGSELEVLPNALKIRAGTYLEPTRFARSSARLHATGGFDVRLFETSLLGLTDPVDLRAGAAIDLAERYTNWGVNAGFWH